MPTARSQQIDLSVTPFYHCYVRCVRRAYLCGEDHTGRNYEHRRAWITERFNSLATIFAIDVVVYAVMHNHYHVVLHVDKDRVMQWDDNEVIQRWHQLVKTSTDLTPTPEIIELWRNNLHSISWFMRMMNEYVARQANQEDDVTGRFWEGRFRSQALLDEGALLTCAAYVDLNPIRAKMTTTLENSDYTAIQQRLAIQAKTQPPLESLMPFQSEKSTQTTNSVNTPRATLPFTLPDYIELLQWTANQIRDNKAYNPTDVPVIVKSAGLNPATWLHSVKNYGNEYQGIAGVIGKIKAWASKIGQQFIRNQNLSLERYLCSD